MENFKDIFADSFKTMDYFNENVLEKIFGKQNCDFGESEEYIKDDADRKLADYANILSLKRVGSITTNEHPIEVFEAIIKDKIRIARSRVGIQALVRRKLGQYLNAFIIFHYQKTKQKDDDSWRFSYLFKEGRQKDITNPKRFTYLFGKNYSGRTATERFNTLANKVNSYGESLITDQDLIDAFSVEALTQEFYGKLYNWYLWAVDDRSKITFPNRTNTDKDDRENIQTKMLRLITRLMFVWFIKQKHLVPDSLFDTKTLGSILRNFDPLSKTEGNYYNAILQNLFFATLNQEIADRQFISDKIFQGRSDSYSIKNLYRDNENESWFTFPDVQKKQRVMQLFETVPYLNGGLFDCLDKFKFDPETKKLIPDKFYDGFSSKETRSPNGNYKYRAFVPNCFFFAPEHKEIVKDNSKEQEKNVCGLIELFRQYNFTVEENSPDDSVVSLDPELLGKVFENLLAAYNPETQESARKSTGSYYTPREIVDYMVNESLINYLTVKCGHQETAIRTLFDDQQHIIPSNAQKVASDLRNIRILDPACGSGAFPMGILLRITTILERLQTSRFNKYQTKIDLIKNCIFGIDIQPIAMLICKLRFFITLICDSEYKTGDKDNNYGIIPLPSLETKFVAANSLIPAQVRKYDNDWTQDDYLLQMKQQLIDLRKQALEIRSHKARSANQAADIELCNKIEEYIISTTTQPDKNKIEKWQRQIETDKIELQKYKDKQWVDKTVAQPSLFGFHEPSIFRYDINASKRNKINTRINNCVDAISREQSKSAPNGFSEAIRQVTRWNPYDQNSISPFFDADWMFGITDGFDIVIGNPPYQRIRGIRESNPMFADYLSKTYKTATGSFDLYVTFVERGLELSNETGLVNYIMPTKWTNSDFGKGLRALLSSQYSVSKIINFGAYQVFNASTYTGIQWFSRYSNHFKYFELNRNLSTNDELKHYLDTLNDKDANIVNIQSLTEKQWVLTNKTVTDILNTIELQPRKIKDVFDKIFQGIATSKDDVYFIYNCKLNNTFIEGESKQLGRKVQIELGLVKPLLKGDGVRKYATISTDRYIIFPYKMVNGKAVLYNEDEMYNLYPQGYAYLKECELILRERENGRFNIDGEWFQYGRKQGILFAEKEKLVAPEISLGGNFAYDKKGMFYSTTKVYGYIKKESTKESYKFWMALFNSRLFWFFIQNTGYVLRGGYYTFKTNYVNPFPVPSYDVTCNVQDIMNRLVDYLIYLNNPSNQNILNHTSNTRIASHIMEIVDMVVYELYFEKHMIDNGIDIVSYLKENLWFQLSDMPIEIERFYLWYQKPENLIRQRIMLLETRSYNLLYQIHSTSRV